MEKAIHFQDQLNLKLAKKQIQLVDPILVVPKVKNYFEQKSVRYLINTLHHFYSLIHQYYLHLSQHSYPIDETKYHN